MRVTGGALTVTLVAVSSELTLTVGLLLLAGLLWIGATLGYARRRAWSKQRTRLNALVDLTLLIAIAALTGGAESLAWFVLWLGPFSWAATIDRRGYLALAALGPLSFVVMWVLDNPTGPAGTETLVTFTSVYVASLTVGLIVLQLRLDSAERAATLHGARVALLHELSVVERTERERMSNQLHDGPLQAFISAQQDLGEHYEGDPDALPLAISTLDDGIVELRRTITELFPSDAADVRTKVQALCRTVEQRRPIHVELHVDPELAHVHNDVVVGIVGELVTNASKHSKARALLVNVALHDHHLAILVRDDGVGMTLRDRDLAARSGHIGLASIDRRVRALGGRWRIRSAPERGTSVTVELPR